MDLVFQVSQLQRGHLSDRWGGGGEAAGKGPAGIQQHLLPPLQPGHRHFKRYPLGIYGEGYLVANGDVGEKHLQVIWYNLLFSKGKEAPFKGLLLYHFVKS